jgi:hypothetical protein
VKRRANPKQPIDTAKGVLEPLGAQSVVQDLDESVANAAG